MYEEPNNKVIPKKNTRSFPSGKRKRGHLTFSLKGRGGGEPAIKVFFPKYLTLIQIRVKYDGPSFYLIFNFSYQALQIRTNPRILTSKVWYRSKMTVNLSKVQSFKFVQLSTRTLVLDPQVCSVSYRLMKTPFMFLLFILY